MSKEFEILNWDSAFFGIKVARLNDSFHPADLGGIINEMRNSHIKVAYCFALPDDLSRNNSLLQNGAKLVDEKVTFCIDTKVWSHPPIENVFPYEKQEVDPSLVRIAQQTSEYSRFRVDEKFGNDACNKLYHQWIKNAVEKNFDNHLFVYKNGSEILGLVTLKDLPTAGSIGLIGIDAKARGKSAGTSLLNQAILHYLQNGIYRVEVVTQKANVPACRFYEKNGFEVCHSINVYHLWL